jgi:hypothetical protein
MTHFPIRFKPDVDTSIEGHVIEYDNLINKELADDIKNNNPNQNLEFADCFILLFGAANSAGMSYQNIIDAINQKMEINYQRKWGKPNEDGVVNHLKK